MANVRVIGDKQILKALGKIEAEIRADALEAIVHAAAEPVTEEAQDRAPKRTRNLAEHIKQETLEKSDTSVTVGVGPDDQEAWYGGLVELGTGPHRIERDQARGLEVENDKTFAANVDHPGAEAQPFLRPALDSQADAAVRGAVEALKALIG